MHFLACFPLFLTQYSIVFPLCLHILLCYNDFPACDEIFFFSNNISSICHFTIMLLAVPSNLAPLLFSQYFTDVILTSLQVCGNSAPLSLGFLAFSGVTHQSITIILQMSQKDYKQKYTISLILTSPAYISLCASSLNFYNHSASIRLYPSV